MEVTVRINPEMDERVVALQAEVERSVAYANAFVVAKREDVEQATLDLSLMAGLKKQIEDGRKEYVDPLNAHVKAVNEAFKVFSEPLKEADATLRGKVLTYNKQQAELQRKQAELEALQKELQPQTGEVYDPVPAVAPPIDKAFTDAGTMGTRVNWHWEVEDITKVPMEYLMVNSSMVGKVVRAGQHKIAGIKIWPEDSLTIQARGE